MTNNHASICFNCHNAYQARESDTSDDYDSGHYCSKICETLHRDKAARQLDRAVKDSYDQF